MIVSLMAILLVDLMWCIHKLWVGEFRSFSDVIGIFFRGLKDLFLYGFIVMKF